MSGDWFLLGTECEDRYSVLRTSNLDLSPLTLLCSDTPTTLSVEIAIIDREGVLTDTRQICFKKSKCLSSGSNVAGRKVNVVEICDGMIERLCLVPG